MVFPLLVFLVATISWIVWFALATNKNEKYLKNIPGPSPLPIFGNVLEVSSTKDILDVLLKFTRQFGGIYKVYLGPIRKMLVVADYKHLEFILNSTRILSKAEEYLYIRPWLGTGLLTSDGAKWKAHRKILTPAFHFQILEQFIDIFESEGNRLIQKLRNHVGQSSFDIYPYITLCTLDIICETAMGVSVNAQFDDNSNYVRSVNSMCRIIAERFITLLQMNDVTFPLTKNYYLQKKSLKYLHSFTDSVVTQRRKELKNGLNGASATKKKKAFLDLLLEVVVDGKPLTQEEIREEVDTFMFEGHDTTASAIGFALYCLANHSDVQSKAYEEQVALFGKNKTPPMTYANLQSMKYLELVIKETLRLYPSVPFYARKTTEPVQCNGIFIPEGITLNIFAYGIHRDPTYFEDPEKFDPSRFESIDGKHPYAYIPFSAGPRNCIGQRFAMLEMKSTISKILRTFELKPAVPAHNLELIPETVLKSANGIKINLELRL